MACTSLQNIYTIATPIRQSLTVRTNSSQDLTLVFAQYNALNIYRKKSPLQKATASEPELKTPPESRRHELVVFNPGEVETRIHDEEIASFQLREMESNTSSRDYFTPWCRVYEWGELKVSIWIDYKCYQLQIKSIKYFI